MDSRRFNLCFVINELWQCDIMSFGFFQLLHSLGLLFLSEDFFSENCEYYLIHSRWWCLFFFVLGFGFYQANISGVTDIPAIFNELALINKLAFDQCCDKYFATLCYLLAGEEMFFLHRNFQQYADNLVYIS